MQTNDSKRMAAKLGASFSKGPFLIDLREQDEDRRRRRRPQRRSLSTPAARRTSGGAGRTYG